MSLKREAAELARWDWICNFFARRGQGLTRDVGGRPSDPFELWVAELGVREGQWMRRAEAAAA